MAEEHVARGIVTVSFFIKINKKEQKIVTTMRLSRITFYNHGEDKSKIAGESKAGILPRKIRLRIETGIIINLIIKKMGAISKQSLDNSEKLLHRIYLSFYIR